MSASPSPEQYQRLFQFHGYVTYAIADEFMRAYTPYKALSFGTQDMWISYMEQTAFAQALDAGVEIYCSEAKYAALARAVYEVPAIIEKTYVIVIHKTDIQKQDAETLFALFSDFRNVYHSLEFFSTDKAFALKEENEVIRKNFSTFDTLKLDGRTFLNTLYFRPDCYFNELLRKIAGEVGISKEDIFQYSLEEILALFDGIQVSHETLERRLTAYAIFVLGSSLHRLEGKDAQTFVSLWKAHDSHGVVHGQIAYKGKVSGRAKVIKVVLNEILALSDTIAAMNQGDILVAETTEPSIIAACKKASAIVTNQGGMMSHAAIVAREMKIPCIVGTGNATEVISDGDMIEVDAENGIVRKIV